MHLHMRARTACDRVCVFVLVVFVHCSCVLFTHVQAIMSGPVMAAFEAPGNLFYYEKGVFTGESPKAELQPKEDGVTIVGVKFIMSGLGFCNTLSF